MMGRRRFLAMPACVVLAFGLAQPPCAAASSVPVLAHAAGGVVVTPSDLLLALTGLSPDEQRVYLADPERVRLLAERLALTFERTAAFSYLGEAQRAAAELEGKLAAYVFARRAGAMAVLDNPVINQRVDARAAELFRVGDAACAVPERFKAAHILIRTDNKSLDAAVAKSNAAFAELRGGAAFADVAKKFSEDLSSSASGGNLPPFSRDQIDGRFAQVYFSDLKPGRVIEPFLTRYGIHIVRVEGDPIPASRMTYDECGPALVKIAQGEITDAVFSERFAEIKEKARVETDTAAIAELAAEYRVQVDAKRPKNSADLIRNALRIYEQQKTIDRPVSGAVNSSGVNAPLPPSGSESRATPVPR